MDTKTAQRILAQTEETYDIISSQFIETRKKRVWEELRGFRRWIKKGDKVLDVGCGSGRLFTLLSDIPIEYVGVDTSKRFLEYSRRAFTLSSAALMSQPKFLAGDMRELPCLPEEFDCVCMVSSLNHLPACYHKIALKEAHRVLKKGGMLLMTNFNLWRFSLRGKTVWRYKFPKLTSWKSRDGLGFKDVITYWSGHPLYYYAFTLAELKRICKEAGFTVMDAYYAYHGRRATISKGENLVLIGKK